MVESRRRARIRKAVESRGYGIAQIDWESWYNGGEKSGICGGWTVLLDRDYLPNTHPGNDLRALSVEEVLAEVDYWLKPTEPCGCGRTHHPARPLLNEPQALPLHDGGCRWHIPYRLPWWNPDNDA